MKELDDYFNKTNHSGVDDIVILQDSLPPVEKKIDSKVVSLSLDAEVRDNIVKQNICP